MSTALITLLTSDTSTTTTTMGWSSIIWMVVILVAFYFILIRPQRKKDKQDAEMRKNLQLGDEVVTAGGIVGIICKIEEETVVIETGGDRSRLRVRRWAISQNLDAEKEAAAAKNSKSASPAKDKKKDKKSDKQEDSKSESTASESETKK
ncbi:MAG: preprotein translocase subunit YajC [Oscillospiraceae bacterium]|nr:preprotein translocase subunit YajC [Oscillospiraceae bacterium]MCD7803747.1 preprotein translocase subunit YajC [Oscillospiraceae bacterium]